MTSSGNGSDMLSLFGLFGASPRCLVVGRFSGVGVDHVPSSPVVSWRNGTEMIRLPGKSTATLCPVCCTIGKNLLSTGS